MRTSVRLYRWLVRLYPAGFREDYGGPLARQFSDERAEAVSRRDLLQLWGRTLLDLARSLPVQLAREMVQDTGHTLRTWRQRPLPIAFAVGVMAFAIGANTGVFSVLNALLLRTLPFEQPERLSLLWMGGPGYDGVKFRSWHKATAYLDDAANYAFMDVNVEHRDATVRVRLAETSANFFQVLGIRPALGRAFAEGEDVAGRGAVAVISYGLWQQMFGGGPDVLDSTVRVNGATLRIVGVAPPTADFPEHSAVWSPTIFDYPAIPKSGGVSFAATVGRLKAGLSWSAAQAAFEAEAFAERPERQQADAANRPQLRRLREELAGPVRSASLLLMAGVVLLLCMAIASVANLLLGRTAARANEFRIRIAIGASRARIVQQLLTESVLLSALAAAAGLAVAQWTVTVATVTQPATLTAQAYTLLDWRVLGFTMALSVLTGVGFGLAPAFGLGRTELSTMGRTAQPDPRLRWLRTGLVVAQIAISIVLFSGSLALGRAFKTLMNVDHGFAVDRIATLTVSLAGTPQQDRGAAYYPELLRRVRAVPGVVAASATQFLPLDATSFIGGRFSINSTGTPVMSYVIPVAEDFFHAMDGRILYGRDFVESDRTSAERPAIVSEGLARQFGDPAHAVGAKITAAPNSGAQKPAQPRTIVGVVADIRYYTGSDPDPELFIPVGTPATLTVVALVDGRARDRMAEIRSAVEAIDPRVPLFQVKSMEERLNDVLARPKFYTTTLVFFAGLALVLAVTGVYGVVSYLVVQRTREMGIRLALGTTAGRLRTLVLRESVALAAIGVLPGVWGAIVGGRYLQTLVHGADAGSGLTAAAASAITLSAVAATVWLATRHIARLDITDVLRAEQAE